MEKWKSNVLLRSSTKYGTAVLTEFDTTALKLVITQEELENESIEDFEYGE